MGERNHAVFVGDQVLDVNVALVHHDLGTPRVGIFLANGQQVILHHAEQLAGIGEQLLQVGNALLQSLIFRLQFAAFQPGQLVEAHIKDGVGLDFRKAKRGHQLNFGGLAVFRGADDAHHVIEVIQRLQQSFQNVGAGFGLAQFKLRTAGQHLEAVVNEALQKLLEVHDPRASVVNGQHDGAKRAAQLRLLVQVVQHHLPDFALLELHHHADAVLVGLVAQVADTFDFLLMD